MEDRLLWKVVLTKENMNIQEIINTPCKELKLLDETERWKIAKQVAEYYQAQGFPYFSLTPEQLNEVAIKMWKFNVNSLDLPGDQIQQNMLGLNLVNFFHPQMWGVPCSTSGGASLTPLQVFWDIDLLTKAIFKRIQYSDTKLQPFNIRKAIQVFGGYRVSNFRPTVAKYIYEKYCPKGGKVLDPCAGYSGRLLGAITSSTVYEYVGFDPDERQIRGGAKLTESIMPAIPKANIDVDLWSMPFEDSELEPLQFDLVFTSPPYFDKEMYSDDHTQSYVRFPTYEAWVDGFLYTLISKSYCALKTGGYFAINVAGNNIVHDTLEYSNNLFGKPVAMKRMRLSKVLGHGNTGTFKLENIYIYQKL